MLSLMLAVVFCLRHLLYLSCILVLILALFEIICRICYTIHMLSEVGPVLLFALAYNE